MPRITTQLASDPDGFAIELLDRRGNAVAVILRSDTDHTVTIWGADAVRPEVLERFVEKAMRELKPFEDGTPLPPRAEWLEGVARR